METVTITLNGREVSGHPGMTILELARESGVDIPTLCHDPRLIPIGACRICLVEDERSGALPASCATPIASGMVINTQSPKVLERRKTIVQLILASHPDSCLVCDKGNRCELRRIASELGIGEVGFDRIPQPATIEEVNPFIERDLSKCVLCAKCIRADQEIVVEGAIDYMHRGFCSKPATLNDMPLEGSECTFCGTCVAICPTGALMERQPSYRGTTSERVSTVCPLCGCGCGVILEVKGDHVVRAVPDTESAVSRGALCVKGSYGYDFIHSPQRLKSPLVKADDGFEETSWEQALELVASNLNRIKESQGPDSLAVLGCSRCTLEENYLLQRLARGALATNNIDNGSRLYDAASRIGLGSVVGFPGTTSTLESLEGAEVILLIGADLASSAPAVAYAVKRSVRKWGSKLLIIDPRRTRLSPFVHLWLRPRVGSDVALINGLANVIVDEGALDEEFVARKTNNFEEFAAGLEPYTPEYVEEVTGVPRDEVRRAARLFAGAGRASIIYGNGITQHVNGTDGVAALANLAMLTGNVSRRGGIYAMQRDCNGQGACDMGALPDMLPGYQSVESEAARERFAERWRVELPAAAGLTALEMIAEAGEGRIKGMYIAGENPVASFPQPGRVLDALASLDFLAVSDLFLTETAMLADVVLPAASFAEKDGTLTNFEGRVQRMRKAIEPYADSLPDWEIILRLAEALGHPMGYPSLQQVREEIEGLVPLYQEIGYAGSGMRGLAEWDRDPLRTRRLYKGQFPSGFGRFSPARYQPPPDISQDGYAFTLLAGSVLYHCGNGSRSSRSPRLAAFSSQGYVEMGLPDAERVGVAQGEGVKVISPFGEVETTVEISDALPEGVVFMPISFPSTPVNRLFSAVLDPRSKTPALKSCAVRLERI